MRCLFGMVMGFVLVCGTASAKPLSADISNTSIELHASFSGTDLLLFGARNEPGDIVIVVRGPASNVTVREKQRIAGMWMFARKAKYDHLPEFVALAATEELRDIKADELISLLALDADTIARRSAASANTDTAFHHAVMRIREKEKLYSATPAKVSFFGETLFKTRIHFPDTMPRGDYQAEIYLIDEGRLVAAQVLPIHAVKTGFEAWLFTLSREQPLWYGLMAVGVALVCGWFAHRMFRKR